MFEIQSETRVGLYVIYSLLTKGITYRLHKYFNRFCFTSRFTTFRSRLLADIWGSYGRTDAAS